VGTQNSLENAEPSGKGEDTCYTAEDAQAGVAEELSQDELDLLIKFFLLLDAWDKKDKLEKERLIP